MCICAQGPVRKPSRCMCTGLRAWATLSRSALRVAKPRVMAMMTLLSCPLDRLPPEAPHPGTPCLRQRQKGRATRTYPPPPPPLPAFASTHCQSRSLSWSECAASLLQHLRAGSSSAGREPLETEDGVGVRARAPLPPAQAELPSSAASHRCSHGQIPTPARCCSSNCPCSVASRLREGPARESTAWGRETGQGA